MPNVFISYARTDSTIVDDLEERLIERTIAVWRDQHNIYGGQQWPKVIGEAIADCDAMLLLWSANSAASHFVEFEWTTALALKKTIIPCLLDETKLPPALAAAFYFASRAVPSPAQPAPSPTVAETIYLRGQVDDERGNPLPGVIVRVDEINGRAEPMWGTTDSYGGFYVEKILARVGDRVRIYVSKAGYVSTQGAAQHDEYIALPGPLKNVKLERKK